MKQKLLFIDSRRHIGGDGIVLTTMFQHLSADKFTKIVAVPETGELGNRLSRLPGRCLRMSFGFGDTKLQQITGLIATIISLAAFVWTEKITVVHSNNTKRSLFIAIGLYFATLGRIKLIYHGHCSPQKSLVHWLALKVCTQLWAVSRYVAEQYMAAGVPESRVHVIYNGRNLESTDQTLVREWREKLGLSENAKVAVICGRLAPVKGQHVAIEAFARWSKSQEDAHLLIVGDDAISDNNENYVPGLKRLAQELDVADSVHFCGFQSQVAPLLKLADVVLVPSLDEPFGLTAIEALSEGCSLLASGSGGLGEILQVAEIMPVERTGTGFAVALEQFFQFGKRLSTEQTKTRIKQFFSVAAFIRRVENQLTQMA